MIEGVSATRSELEIPWALRIWVDAPRAVRLERAVERDGAEMLPRWLDVWMPSEEAYIARDRPEERADLGSERDGLVVGGRCHADRVRETPEELEALQALLGTSFARASRHLSSIMEEPRRLSAARIAAELPSPAVLNIASVTARGEPRVSAVDGHFLHGHWYFGTDAGSPKARQLRARPAISTSYTPRDGYGHARIDADWLVGFAMTPDEEAELARQRAEREARRSATL